MGTGQWFDKPADDPCYEPRMTRAEAIARRTAGTLRENCVVVVTDGPTIGTPGNTSPTEIELNPTSPTELGLTARVHTTFDDSAWAGTYDIDLGTAGSITRLTDSSQNTAVDNDADSPTVHTQFPWHLGTTLGGNWRDNYAEDAVLTSAETDAIAPKTVTNSKFINTTMDFTGWTTGIMSDTLIQGTGIHHIFGGFVQWTRSTVISATVNAQTALIQLVGSEILDNSTLTTTGAGTISVSGSRVEDGSIINNAGDRNITVTNSTIRAAAQLQNDAGSLKAFSITTSTVEGAAIIRGQAGTVVRGVGISNSRISGRPGGGDTMIILGDGSITFNACDISTPSTTWIVDGPTTAAALQWTNVYSRGGNLNHGPLATNCQWTNVDIVDCIVDVQGSSSTNFAYNVRDCDLTGTTLRISAGSSGQVSLTNVTATGSGTIAIDNASPRNLSVDGGTVLTGVSSIIETGTTAPTGLNAGDRITNCTLLGGVIEFATTVGGIFGNNVSNSLIIGGPNAPGVPDGHIRIDGTSARVFLFQNEVLGEILITDAPEGALSGPTAVYDNYVGSSCFLTYIGGDAVVKQIRNNRIEGNASRIDCVGLTGSAGAALADVFSSRVANQAVLTVSGARVVGFPVRNCIVENGATLTIPANGSALQFIVANNFDLDTGAFTHFDSEFSGNFAQTLTAVNSNKLHNVGFDNSI